MPTFTFRDNETGEEFEEFMTNSEKETFLETNPHYEQILRKAPAIGDPVRLGVTKPDAGFGEVLSKIHKAHPLGNVKNSHNTRKVI